MKQIFVMALDGKKFKIPVDGLENRNISSTNYQRSISWYITSYCSLIQLPSVPPTVPLNCNGEVLPVKAVVSRCNDLYNN